MCADEIFIGKSFTGETFLCCALFGRPHLGGRAAVTANPPGQFSRPAQCKFDLGIVHIDDPIFFLMDADVIKSSVVIPKRDDRRLAFVRNLTLELGSDRCHAVAQQHKRRRHVIGCLQSRFEFRHFQPMRHLNQAGRCQPTLPSSETAISFCASTANSIGSCCSTSLTNPLTTSAVASSADKPRCRQ
jgi:hypothetical protein